MGAKTGAITAPFVPRAGERTSGGDRLATVDWSARPRDRMSSSNRLDRPETAATAPPQGQAPALEADACGHGRASRPAGLAHVSALSFLAARASPAGAFVLALAGGVSLARAGERFGARIGYGASLAAMIQTVAYLGPARVNGPLTQALTAPMMGALERRGVGRLGQFLACAVGRILHNTLATAFFVWVLIGGLDAYAGTYDELLESLSLAPVGVGGTLALTAVMIIAWAALASAIQVHFYRRGLRRWPATVGPGDRDEAAEGAGPGGGRRFDPRAVAVASGVAFGLLLATTEWPLLAAVAAWLAVAWALSRPDREAVPTGVVLAVLIGGGSLGFSLVGGLGLEEGLRRGTRAVLLVLVATWLRAAAGSAGIREVARRSLGRLRRVPAVAEAGALLDDLGTGGRLAPPGRALLGALGSARKRPLPVIDAVLGWVTTESDRFRASVATPVARLRARPTDGALVALAAAPGIVLAVG